MKPIKIGLISDTHGLLRPEVASRFSDVEIILHAGDIGGKDVIRPLEDIARLVAVRGNCDYNPPASLFPEYEIIEIGGRSILLIHDLDRLDLDPASANIDIVVHGHTHIPSVGNEKVPLLVNPGSAGPRRPGKPIAIAIMKLDESIDIEPIVLSP